MKNNNKNMHLFAIAALAATLMVGQVSISSVYAGSTSVQLSSLIPDNVTVEQPVPLSDISLPDSEYGTLSWVDSSSVPALAIFSNSSFWDRKESLSHTDLNPSSGDTPPNNC